MAARQRLRMVLEARRASRPCWRCALNLPRHISSSLAGNPGSSNRTDEAPYSRILQQGFEEAMKSHFPDLPPHGVKPALRVSGMDKRGSIRRVRRPRVRRIKVKIDDQQMASAMEPPIATTQRPRITQVMSEGRPVPLRVRLKFFASAPQEPRIRRMSVKIRGQKVASGTEPQSNSMATLQRPRIARIISEVRPVPFRIRSVFIASVSQEPRIRRINVGLDGQQVVSGTEPQSKSMVTMQIPRIARVNSESRPAYVRTEPKSKPIETTQKPRIRLMQDGPTMPLRTESETTSLASQKPRIRVMQDGRTVPLRSQPLVVSLYKHMARMRGIRVDTPRTGRTRLDIRHMSVMADGQQVASSTDLQFKSTETTQKLRTRHIQEKSDDQQVTSSTRSQSRPKRAVNRPRIRIVSTGPPVVLGTRGFPRSEKVEQLLPLRKIRIARSISKEFFVSKCGLDPVIRPFSSMTPPVAEASLPLKNKKIRTKRLVLKRVLFKAKRKRKVIVSERALDPVIRIRRSITPPVAKGPDVVSNKFTRLKVGPVVRKCIDTYDTPSSQEDEACHDELTSVLDVYKDLHKSDLSNPTRETRYSFSSTRFSPQNNVTRRIALSESRTLNQPSLSTSNRSFSSTTGGAPNRRYATATVQTTQADAPINPAIIESNPDGLVKGNPRGIREALRLWQEQHDVALADTSSLAPSGTLGDTQNMFTQSGEDDSFTAIARDEEVEDDDDVNFGSDEPTLDIFAHQVFLRRGDLVELVAASEPILAVFVRNVADQCQFYTIRGEWVNREPGGARWAVSRFMNPGDLNEILPYLPAEEVAEDKMNRLQPIDVHAPRGAGAKIIEQMTLFHQAADAVFRKHADRINRLYEIIAPPEAFADRMHMSLKDIAMKVLMKKDPSELTQPMMWAIHRAIAQSQNIMWDQMNYRQNPIYEIYPQQSLKDISQVREWVREYQEGIIHDTTNDSIFSIDFSLTAATRSLNPIAMFVKKARVAIQQSRRTRPLSQSGFIGPSTVKIEMEEGNERPYSEIHMQEFDNNDKTIIHYLDVWATSSYVNAYTNLASLGPMILRATGMYEGFELDESRGFTLLQELGVVTPWENRTVYRLRNLRLPGHDGGSGEISRLVLDARKEARVLKPKDSMEGLRKDWGEMPIFCIDSAETLERDDGVSLDLVDNDPSIYWVHVHVANPSAFITPGSAIAKYAASLAESVYLPERKYPMLNPGLTKDQFSLANDRPCITFSAKISVDGDILEKKIAPGIVRNVHYLTPQMVGHGLGLTETDEEPETMSILTVGGRMPVQSIEDSNQTAKALTDPEHIKILRKLLELGEAARHKRAQAGAPDFYSSARIATTYPIVQLSNRTGKPFTINDKRVTQFEGDPIISLQRTTAAYGHVAKMVSDLMIIAGDVSASWCSARNIPIPYRGILRNPEPASPPDLFKRDILDPKIAKYGHAQQHDLLRYMRLVGQAHASDRPLDHPALGLPAYCKATSPLRRYVDMYAHWQIEAAIRHEAATGTSLVGAKNDDSHYLPFPRHQVEEFAAGAIHRERKIALAKTSSTRHWICQALFRALYFHEAALPERFDVTAIAGRRGWRGHHAGWLGSWNVKVLMREGELVRREGGWRVGDVWEARLWAVDPYHKNIEMEAVRLVEREKVG